MTVDGTAAGRADSAGAATSGAPGPPPLAWGARRKILFMSEAITLAQVVRLVSLARSLDPREYDVHFAAAHFPERIFRPGEFARATLETVAGERALRRLDRGGRLYDLRTLRRYVAADRAIIRQVRPELVVGDLRWSLAVSGPLEGVPCAALANAYMSPFARRAGGVPLPDHPIVSLLGERLAARSFPKALPAVFDWFARPLNQLRRENGLSPVGGLLDVLTFGDLTLYADAPELFDLLPLPPSHSFLGPVEWSPDDPLPPGWAEDPRRYPVYVTLGSSGDLRLLPRVLEGLRSLPVDVLVATAGRTSLAEARRLSALSSAEDPAADLAGETLSFPSATGARVRIVPFVSGARAAAAARLVISNGGSTTGYQALAAACPVLGLPHNLEQHLAMEGIVRAGAGRSLSARHVGRESLRAAVEEMLGSSSLADGARRVAGHLRRHHATNLFPALVRRVLDERSGGKGRGGEGDGLGSGSGREGAPGQQPRGEGTGEDHHRQRPDVAHEDVAP
jgi:UDP:flavonoid glycosyltransferase YjiC (YdhE family)